MWLLPIFPYKGEGFYLSIFLGRIVRNELYDIFLRRSFTCRQYTVMFSFALRLAIRSYRLRRVVGVFVVFGFDKCRRFACSFKIPLGYVPYGPIEIFPLTFARSFVFSTTGVDSPSVLADLFVF